MTFLWPWENVLTRRCGSKTHVQIKTTFTLQHRMDSWSGKWRPLWRKYVSANWRKGWKTWRVCLPAGGDWKCVIRLAFVSAVAKWDVFFPQNPLDLFRVFIEGKPEQIKSIQKNFKKILLLLQKKILYDDWTTTMSHAKPEITGNTHTHTHSIVH